MLRLVSRCGVVAALSFLLVSIAQPAAAQTPAAGTTAFGGDIGVFFPRDGFENSIALAGYGEYYLTNRVGFRTMVGWVNPGIENHTEDHFRQGRLLFNLTYNWEGGALHPFVTGGAGAYFVRLKQQGRTDPDGETRGGLNFGGGFEYFANRQTSFKTELRWDIISYPNGGLDATGATLTVGLKRYF